MCTNGSGICLAHTTLLKPRTQRAPRVEDTESFGVVVGSMMHGQLVCPVVLGTLQMTCITILVLKALYGHLK